jgi:hypothetical protein
MSINCNRNQWWDFNRPGHEADYGQTWIDMTAALFASELWRCSVANPLKRKSAEMPGKILARVNI